MRAKTMKIPKPVIKVTEVFDSCISNMRAANQQLFRPCLPKIVTSTEEYEHYMENGDLEKVAQSESISGVPKHELEKLYTNKLSKAKQPARKYYDKIISAAPMGLCPYCRQQIVSTLDHYYPKAHYISLVISPTNLIPTCANCNKNKADVVVHKKEDAILNPYYEDLDSLIWLSAEIVKDIASNFLTMTFSVLPPNDCDPVLCARLKNQFAVLHLNDLYSKHAAEEMIAVFNRHSRIYKVAGTIGVKESILESLEENKYRPNSWQSAMYRALNDEWYLTKWLPQKYSENI